MYPLAPRLTLLRSAEVKSMFKQFCSLFQVDPGTTVGWWRSPDLVDVDGYESLLQRFAGRSFNGGLYRLHSAHSAALCQSLVGVAFPEFRERVRVFGMDWLGRQAALDLGRVVDGQPQVLLLEPGTFEALEVPVSFRGFHEEELVEFRNEALASEFFGAWRAASGWDRPLSLDECVGYVLPLFLGGRDDTTNLEVIDVSVYWHLVSQLRSQTRGQDI